MRTIIEFALCLSATLVRAFTQKADSLIFDSFTLAHDDPLSHYQDIYKQLAAFRLFEKFSEFSNHYSIWCCNIYNLDLKEYVSLLEKCLIGASLADVEVQKIIVGTLSCRYIPQDRRLFRFFYFLLNRMKGEKRKTLKIYPRLAGFIEGLLEEGDCIYVRPFAGNMRANRILGAVSDEDLQFFEAAYLFNVTAGYGYTADWTSEDGKPILLDIQQGSIPDMHEGFRGLHELALSSLGIMVKRELDPLKRTKLKSVIEAARKCSDAFARAWGEVAGPAVFIPLHKFPPTSGYYHEYESSNTCPLLIFISGHIFGIVFCGDELYIRGMDTHCLGTILRFRLKVPGRKLTERQFSRLMAAKLTPSVVREHYEQVAIEDESLWRSNPQPSGLCPWVSFTGIIKILLNLNGICRDEYKLFMKITRQTALRGMLEKTRPQHFQIANDLIYSAILRSPDRQAEFQREVGGIFEDLNIESHKSPWLGDTSRCLRKAFLDSTSSATSTSREALLNMRRKYSKPHPLHAGSIAGKTFVVENGKRRFTDNLECGIFWILSGYASLAEHRHYPKLTFPDHIYPLYANMPSEEKQLIINSHRKDELCSMFHKIALYRPTLTCRQIEVLFDLSFSSVSDFYRNESLFCPYFVLDEYEEVTKRGTLLAGLLSSARSCSNHSLTIRALYLTSLFSFSPKEDRPLAQDIFHRLCLPVLTFNQEKAPQVPGLEGWIISDAAVLPAAFYEAFHAAKAIADCLEGADRAKADGLLKKLSFVPHDPFYIHMHVYTLWPLLYTFAMSCLALASAVLCIWIVVGKRHFDFSIHRIRSIMCHGKL